MPKSKKRRAGTALVVHNPSKVGKGVVAPPPPKQIPLVIQNPPQPVALTPVQVPRFSASVMNVQSTGNEFTLLFQSSTPVQGPDGRLETGKALNQSVVLIHLSPQTAKDLALVMTASVEKHEQKYGKMNTPYTERLKTVGAQKTTKKKKAKAR